MSAPLESENALRSRALEVSLTAAEAEAIIRNGVTALARLAFAACHPGQTPTDVQLQQLLGTVPLNPGNSASLKRLIFESQTLVCNEVKFKANRRDDSIPTTLAGAERDHRIEQQKQRLSGFRFRGEEECSHQSYDLALSMLEKNTVLYLSPDKFPTRRHELQKKPAKELTIDQSQLIVKEKQQDLTCPTLTELEIANALKRRALAFDLVGLCAYSTLAAYNADLLDHLHLPPPPGYSAVTVQQLLRTDRAAFMFKAERLTTLKANARGELPLDEAIPKVLGQPSVAFHLLPLGQSAAHKESKNAPTKPKRDRSRSPRPAQASKPKGKGRGKSKRAGRGPNIPAGLIGKALETPQKKRLCWAFNLPNGCPDAKPGESCKRGLHACAEPGCFSAHCLQNHR
eukprot:s3841_g10.t1